MTKYSIAIQRDQQVVAEIPIPALKISKKHLEKAERFVTRAFKLLREHDGDVSKVMDAVCARANAKVPAPSPAAPAVDERIPAKLHPTARQFSAEMAQLSSYDMPVRTVRLLAKFGGDVERVRERLEEVKRAEAQKKAAVAARVERQRAVQERKKAIAEDRAAKIAAATEEKAATEASPAPASEMDARIPRHLRPLAEQYRCELARLASFNMPVRTLQLLRKFNGDVEQTSVRLAKIQEREAKVETVKEPESAVSPSTEAAPEDTATAVDDRIPEKLHPIAAKYAAEMAELSSFDMPVRGVRLLNKFNGDVSKAAARLQQIKEAQEKKAQQQLEKAQKKAQKQQEKLAVMAQTNSKAQTMGHASAPEKSVVDARIPANLRPVAEKYAEAMSALAAYDMPVRSVRLLNKFNGNVEQVRQRLERVAAKQKQVNAA